MMELLLQGGLSRHEVGEATQGRAGDLVVTRLDRAAIGEEKLRHARLVTGRDSREEPVQCGEDGLLFPTAGTDGGQCSP